MEDKTGLLDWGRSIIINYRNSLYLELSKKMGEIDPDLEVPDYYIENELKSYLNKNYGIVPEISLRK